MFVVIGYNNPRLTEDCLASFRASPANAAVWLYDNASNPPLRSVAEKYASPYLFSTTNLGFAGGANRAIEWVLRTHDAQAVCIVNNDVVVSEAFSTPLGAELRGFLEDPRLAAMTPLLYADQTLSEPENFGVLYYQSGLAFQNRTGRLEHGALLNGAFLFLKTQICRQLIEQDGDVFSSDFFLNAEDIELSLRLLSRGYTIRVNPNLRVRHLGSQSVRHIGTANFRLAWRNLLWTLLMTRTSPELMGDAPCIVAGQLVQVGLSALRGRPDLFLSVMAETWGHRRQLLESRRRFLGLKQHAFRDFVRPGVFPLARRR